jgi:hypothetical protein
MKTRCATCAGVYDSVSGDGVTFYHRCPPLRVLRVRELDGTYSTVLPGNEGVRPVVMERAIPRPNERDENLQRDPTTGKAVPIATGTGVTSVPDNSIP